MKSTYSFPSRSQTRDPRPRSSTTGPGEYTAAPRDGEFTPSISDCCARAYQARDCSRRFVFVVIFNIIKTSLDENSKRSGQPPTIDNQRRTRNKRRRIASQIQGGLRNFIRCPYATQRTLCRFGEKGVVFDSELLRFLA